MRKIAKHAAQPVAEPEPLPTPSAPSGPLLIKFGDGKVARLTPRFDPATGLPVDPAVEQFSLASVDAEITQIKFQLAAAEAFRADVVAVLEAK